MSESMEIIATKNDSYDGNNNNKIYQNCTGGNKKNHYNMLMAMIAHKENMVAMIVD